MDFSYHRQSQEDLRLKLDEFHRKFSYKSKRSKNYRRNLNDVILYLLDISSSRLRSIPSHPFYHTLRKLLTALLVDWHSSYSLTTDEVFLLHNCVAFLARLAKSIKNLTLLSSWFLDQSLINALADCMNQIDRLIAMDKDKQKFKQLVNLFELFSRYFRQLSVDSQNDTRFDCLFDATMNCLTSLRYDQLFRRLKVQEKSLSIEEKFLLTQCPAFLISKPSGTHSHVIIEQFLETMIPRYASILDKHIKSIDKWNSGMIHIVHHLLLTILFVRGYYTNYTNGQPFQWLTDVIVRIISQPSIVNRMNEHLTNYESLIMDSALRVLTAFVHDPDLLIYIKQLQIQPALRALISSSSESIVFHVYTILSFIMDETDIKASEKESGRLLANIFDSLRRELRLLSEKNRRDQLIEHNITLLVEAIQALVQHDYIKSEILNQNALPVLINNIQRINGTSQRLMLESLGSMTFDEEAARLLRGNAEFIDSVKTIQNTMDNGIKKAAEKIIWNLVEEPEKLKKIDSDDDEDKPKKEKFEYDIMISYCHADKEFVYKVHRYLADKGYKIWIDKEQIYGPAMQAMAEAVEKSEFIILCMSNSYKRSVYCQAEAEYAFRCQRKLLPLIVRQEYRPDGWLGLLLGSRVYVNFARTGFRQGCEALINEITLQRKNELQVEEEEEEKKSNPEVHPFKEYITRETGNSMYRSNSIVKWTHKDVLDFLYDHKLFLMMPLCETLNGRGLKKFFHLCYEKPTKLYEHLNEEFRTRFNQRLPMGVYTQFLAEIEQNCPVTRIKNKSNKLVTARSSSSSSPTTDSIFSD